MIAGGFLWLRDSPLVAIEQVTVTGVEGRDAESIRGALESSAREMTTLAFDPARLEAAVARFPSVAGVRARTRFPHGLIVHVTDRTPVAALEAGGRRVAVAADGILLPRMPAAASLPPVPARSIPTGGRLTEPAARRALTVVAAAPGALRTKIEGLAEKRRRLVVQLREGPELIFGTPALARQKWAAVAALLADPELAGASYLDVQVPDKPAVGGLGAPPPSADSVLPDTDPLAVGEGAAPAHTEDAAGPTAEADVAPEAAGEPGGGYGEGDEDGAVEPEADAAAGIDPVTGEPAPLGEPDADPGY